MVIYRPGKALSQLVHIVLCFQVICIYGSTAARKSCSCPSSRTCWHIAWLSTPKANFLVCIQRLFASGMRNCSLQCICFVQTGHSFTYNGHVLAIKLQQKFAGEAMTALQKAIPLVPIDRWICWNMSYSANADCLLNFSDIFIPWTKQMISCVVSPRRLRLTIPFSPSLVNYCCKHFGKQTGSFSKKTTWGEVFPS